MKDIIDLRKENNKLRNRVNFLEKSKDRANDRATHYKSLYFREKHRNDCVRRKLINIKTRIDFMVR